MTEDAETATPVVTSEVWSATQYEAALAHLEQLQQQIDALRSTIPMLVAPLIQPATSKAQMFVDVKKAAWHAADSITALHGNWTSEQSQQLFARIKQSNDQNGDLTKAGEVASYGWTDR